jgi:hypothetical protein
MFRLLGFLIGSLTSIVIILVIIGMPTLHFDDREANQKRYDSAIDKLREKQQEIESVTGRLNDEVTRVAETVGDRIDDMAAINATPDPDPEPPAPDPATSDPSPLPIDTGPPPEPRWYSFWNPFRSKIAANGFVSRLESVTGIDYRVVKVKAGVYEVAFAYYDDDEKETKLSQISTATGLDLPES